MRPLLPLGGVALALVLSGCGEPGLDLRTPSDAREYVRLCALGRPDIYCKAMLPTLREVQGPVSVILGGGTEGLTRYLAGRGLTVADFQRDPALQAAFARANIFPVGRLSTGTHRTLDGKAHAVRCWPDMEPRAGEPPYSEDWCQIGEFRAINRLHHFKDAVGSIYSTVPSGPDDFSSFFPF
ncbi:hypothetical protein F8S09_02895 [Deinococcus sp. SDU3-2]|uniref:Lipoprotein n=1 Tax=Deinococcus terrestris TaxID=2651870 RepID=A0A7X1NU11_9DEIO|nr:hypothetical protein [Deinococcus terrestris]MPY65643.1 hypothetical protein [Deinococcus terrestris]